MVIIIIFGVIIIIINNQQMGHDFLKPTNNSKTKIKQKPKKIQT